jgi:hypothetical protein
MFVQRVHFFIKKRCFFIEIMWIVFINVVVVFAALAEIFLAI